MSCCEYNFDSPLSSGTIPDTGWEACTITLLRAILGDLGTPPTYSDERLLLMLNASAYYVASDLVCCSAISKPDINYCGVLASNPLEHPSFTNLMVLKSACLIDQAQARIKFAAEGIRATAGPATLQIMSASSSYALLFREGPCAAYSALKDDLCFRCPIQSALFCSQILGPYVGTGTAPNCGFSPDGSCDGGDSWTEAAW